MSCLARQLCKLRLCHRIGAGEATRSNRTWCLSSVRPAADHALSWQRTTCVSRSLSDSRTTKASTEASAEQPISSSFRVSEEEEQLLANERQFEDLTAEMFESIVKDEAEREKLIQALAEYELNKYDTGRVPSTLTLAEMRQLIDLQPHQVIQRTQMLIYFYKRELGKLRDRQRREQNKRVTAERLAVRYQATQRSTGLEFLDDGTPVYGKWRNTMFLHKSEKSLRSLYESRAAQAALFGRKIVFDFGFEHEMERRELTNLGLQMSLAFADNTRSRDPFDLWFCNFKKNTSTERVMLNNIGHIYEPNSLINVTEKSYLDLFDRRKLIYLSPHATKVLREIPSDAIFVIGCIIDRARIVPLTSSKASEEQIDCYKLPLDDFLFFKGKKTLTVNQVFSIMNSVKQDGDWQRALDRHVPKRKLKTCDEVQEEQERKVRKFLHKRRLFSSKASETMVHRDKYSKGPKISDAEDYGFDRKSKYGKADKNKSR
jgi:hypothetical protein